MNGQNLSYDPVTNAFVSDSDSATVHGSVPNLMWHITDLCPLDCPYCFAPKTKDKVDIDELNHILTNIAAIGALKVDISGGEPLTHPALPFIIDKLQEFGIFATLTTSGVGSPTVKAALLDSRSNLSRIIASLDAPTEEHHNTLRRHPRAWQECLGFLDRLSENPASPKLRINTVVTRSFEDSWIDGFQQLLERTQAQEWCLIEPHPANSKPEFGLHKIGERRFQHVVRMASERPLTAKLIFRNNAQYSTYWSLQPSGVLRQHTTGSDDRNEFDLKALPSSAARLLLANCSTIVPTRRNDENFQPGPQS